jgi:sulfate/thiosulfate transport system permease protein
MSVQRERGPLPGFGLAGGTTLLYLGLLVLLPLASLAWKAMELTASDFVRLIASDRALASYRLTFGAAAAAASVNLVFGSIAAWVLERYRFPGRRLVDAIIDLPFALPTAVAGIALAAAYSPNGWLGGWLARLGLEVAYTPLGVVVALTFVGLPFVVRTLQPVVRDLEPALEEAAAALGATRLQTIVQVVLPELVPAAATGFVLALARGLGEYGSVIFIAGNLPHKSEITALLIMVRLEEYDYAGATAIAAVFLFASFALLFAVNRLSRPRGRQSRETSRRRRGER